MNGQSPEVRDLTKVLFDNLCTSSIVNELLSRYLLFLKLYVASCALSKALHLKQVEYVCRFFKTFLSSIPTTSKLQLCSS